jgi:Fur family peroxide stress response transcriptional regulator
MRPDMAEHKDRMFKMTPQRAAIIEFLEGNTSHPSAEDIYKAILEKYPMVSFTTVYNTLETLRGMGRVWELNIDETRKRYDPNTHLHHHMICTGCKAIVDIHVDFPLDLPDEITEGFQVTGRHIEFYGQCPKCRAAKKEL